MKRRFVWRFALGAGLGMAGLHCSGSGERPPIDDLLREPDASDEIEAGTPDESEVIDAGDAGVGDESDARDEDVFVPVDPGPPSFTASRSAIDFGQVGCGKVGAPVSFSLNNTGDAPFSWAARLLAGATSQFTISPASGTLAPGASEAITIEMKGVPFPGTTTAGFYDDVLTLAAKGASVTTKETNIPIKLTAKGAVVRFSPSAVVFGAVPLNQTSNASFGILNDGNAEVELNLVGGNPRFATSPLGPVIVGAGKGATRTVTFTAADITSQVDEIMLTSSNPANSLCAPLPAKGLAVSGIGSNGNVSITPASISFGEGGKVDCGTQANAEFVQIANTGNAPFSWTAKLSSGANFYTLSPTTGTVQANQTTNVQVVPKPIPQTSAVTTDLYAGTVEITTTAVNDPVHIVGLHQTAQGFILSSSLGAGLDFGGVKISTSATKSFSLTNDGNVPVNASLAIGGAPFAVSTSSLLLGPNETTAPTVTFTPPASATYTDSLVVTAPVPAQAGPARCAPLPANASLKGSGSTSVSVSPSSLSFGLVDCGTSANHQTVTLTNAGPAMTFTAVLGKDASSAYTLANDVTGAPVAVGTAISVGAGATYTLRVVPKPIVPPASTVANGFGDTLTLTTTSAGDAPKVVQLNMTARGAFLALTPVSVTASDNACNHTTFYNFNVVNNGNLAGDYTVEVIPRLGAEYPGAFKINLSSGSLFGGQSQAGVLEMRTPSSGPAPSPAKFQYLGDIVLTPKNGTILCSDAQPKSPIALDSACYPPQ